MTHNKITKISIKPDCSLLSAMKQMDELDVKTLLVFNDERFIGILTMGDIQRAIIKNVMLSSSVVDVLEEGKIYGREGVPVDN